MAAFVIREYARIPRKATIMLQTAEHDPAYETQKHRYTPATMHNFGKGGLYFESDRALPPGVTVSVKVLGSAPEDSRERNDVYNVHRGKVRWCKSIEFSGEGRFGVGMEIFETVVQTPVKSSRLA